MRRVLESTKGRAWLPGEPNTWLGLEDRNFHSHRPDLRGGERSWKLNQSPMAKWSDPLYLCNEPSIRSKEQESMRLVSHQVGEHMEKLRERYAQRGHESSVPPSPDLALCFSSNWLFELYSFITNWSSTNYNVSPSSVSCPSKWIKPKEEVVETSDLWPVGQKFKLQPGLPVGIWSGCSGQSCEIEPFTYGIWLGIQRNHRL